MRSNHRVRGHASTPSLARPFAQPLNCPTRPLRLSGLPHWPTSSGQPPTADQPVRLC